MAGSCYLARSHARSHTRSLEGFTSTVQGLWLGKRQEMLNTLPGPAPDAQLQARDRRQQSHTTSLSTQNRGFITTVQHRRRARVCQGTHRVPPRVCTCLHRVPVPSLGKAHWHAHARAARHPAHAHAHAAHHAHAAVSHPAVGQAPRHLVPSWHLMVDQRAVGHRLVLLGRSSLDVAAARARGRPRPLPRGGRDRAGTHKASR
eukprot:708567-Rhodomonas_salina.1